MKKFLAIVFIIYIVFTSSCKFTSEDEYFITPACDSIQINRDTLQVFYEDLTYIFSGICQQCHNDGFTYREGINVQGYENTRSSFNTEKVIPAINHKTVKMPKNQGKLNDCEIQLITLWYERKMPKLN